jgi:hypothetical protein
MSLIELPPSPPKSWDQRHYDLIPQWNAFLTGQVMPLLKIRVDPICIMSLTRWDKPVKHFIKIIENENIPIELKDTIKLLGKELYALFFKFCTEIKEDKWLNAIKCPSSDPSGDDCKSLFERQMFCFLQILCRMRSTNFPSWSFNSTLCGETLLWIMETIGTEFVEVEWDKKKGQFVELSQDPEPEPEPEKQPTPEERLAAARAARKARKAAVNGPVKATCATVTDSPSFDLRAQAAKSKKKKGKRK